MGQPHQPGLALAILQPQQLFFGQRHQRQRCADHKAPEHGFVQPVQAAFKRRTALPANAGQIAAFRIDAGHGEILITVMQQMAVAIQRVRIPHGKRRVAKDLVEANPARRMPVQQLVLQRQPQHQQRSQQQRAQGTAQPMTIENNGKPAAIDADQQQPGRPLGTGSKALAQGFDLLTMGGVEVMGHGIARNGTLPLLCNDAVQSCRLFSGSGRSPRTGLRKGVISDRRCRPFWLSSLRVFQSRSWPVSSLRLSLNPYLWT
ncbi:hypothetical protein D3C81_1319360 [compost metagenome]